MAKAKKDKKPKLPKYAEAPQVEIMLGNILKNCESIFSYFSSADFHVLFRNSKYNPAKKQVAVKILKEPVTLLTPKKLLLLITADWWNAVTDSEKIKAIIEALTGVMTDNDNNFVKRDFDVQTYSDLLKDPEFDFSKFSAVLPSEKKAEELVLTSN